MSTPPLVYISHPFGGDTNNLKRAELWEIELYVRAPGALWLAPWTTLARRASFAFPGLDQFLVARCISWDCAVVSSCDGLLLVGGQPGPGGRAELAAAVSARVPILRLDHLDRPEALTEQIVTTLKEWVERIATRDREQVV